MKRIIVAAVCVMAMAGTVLAEEQAALKTQKDKVSYIIGMDIGNNFKKQGIEIDADMLMKGLKDVLAGSKPLIAEKEAVDTMTAFKQEYMAKQAETARVQSEKNKKDGEAFLSENKKKEGVKTLPSGLQYKVITEGAGKTPKAADTVTVNYRGTLVDGTEFDSSYKRGQPASFPVKGVIPGWVEALQLMKEGDKWQLYIPANLAYGDKNAGLIGPNATLIFDVELITVKETAAAPAK
ncbi:MAG: FKBP-type peptidyl-prolyl cis-trans isomerase [Nitrospirae bacterium]|nr:MAG: FKBP-type peptidyl-prolyl cis-trans isomerase [Nitrospirota bacterium]